MMLCSLTVVSTTSTFLVLASNSCKKADDNDDVKQCNYTVKAQVSPVENRNGDTPNFYIGPGVKGYVSGGWLIDHFTEAFTCTISGNNNFVGANIYIPKWIDVNGTKYTVTNFSGGGSLQAKVVLPDSVNFIGDLAFYSCWELTSVNFKEGSVTHIGARAFSGCTSLSAFNFFGVNQIDDYAFGSDGYIPPLTKIDFDDGMKKIGSHIFAPSSLGYINVTLDEIRLNWFSLQNKNIDAYAFGRLKTSGKLILPKGSTVTAQSLGLDSGWVAQYSY